MTLALTLPRVRHGSVRKWPPLLLLYGTIFPPAAILTSIAFWPMWHDSPILALGSEFLSLALLAAGILLLDEPSQKSPGFMLIAASALLTAGWLDNWHVGPLPLISVPASPLGIVLASWAMFRYPYSSTEIRYGRRFFRVFVACLIVALAIYIALSRPSWNRFAANAWWPTLYADKPLSTAIIHAIDIGGIIFVVVYMALWIRRWKRAHGIARKLAIPIAVAASTAGAATIVELAAAASSVRPEYLHIIYTAEAFIQIGVPAAFLVSVMYRRFARTRIVGLLLRLRGPARAASVTDALRSVFEDPDLEILNWAPGTQSFAGSGRLESLRPGHGEGRLRLPIISSSGEQLAVILADPSLSPNDDLVRAAITASSFALENAQLEAALRAQLQEVRDSRLRIINAGVTERRRIERDLHDGTQQRLFALKIMLAAAESDVTDLDTRTVISRVRDELGQVLEELRDLAHGIHPTVLSQVGLAQAIQSMAERYTMPIDVSLPPGRFPEVTELTAYFVIAESLTNAVKHARAGRIRVDGCRAGSFLRIEIADDGLGGACVAAGTGIRGVIDRVRGVGGELSLDSAAGQGTRIEVRIPCA